MSNKPHCSEHADLISDIKEIKSDVKELISFKSKILGAITIVTFLVTLVFDYLVK